MSRQSLHVSRNGGRAERGAFVVRKSSVFALAGPAFLGLEFVRFLVQDPKLYLIVTMLSLCTGLAFFVASIFQKSINKRILLLAYLFLVLAAVTALQDRNRTEVDIVFFFSHFGFAWALLCGRLSSRVAFFQTALLLAFFFYHAVIGTNPESIFVISRNYISVLAVLSLSLYLFACQEEKRTPSVILLIATMTILLWAIGRAGIISGALFLLGSFLTSGKRYAAAFTFALLLVALSIMYFSNFDTKLDLFRSLSVGIERFQRLSIEGQRTSINIEYWEAISTAPMSLLFGAPIDNIRAIVEVDGNPHNSLINLHIFAGIFGVILFFGLVLHALLILCRNNQFLIALMLFVAIFRSLLDSTAFQGQLDVPILLALFAAFSLRHQGN